MGKRREYELTDEQYARLMDACQPVPYMVIGGVVPPSPRENAEMAWRELGREMGFDGMTARPAPGKSGRFFTAEPVPEEEHPMMHDDWFDRATAFLRWLGVLLVLLGEAIR
jgi:hypothetical protein